MHRRHYPGDLAADAFVSTKKRFLIAGVLLKVKYTQALKLTASVPKQKLPGSGSRPPYPSAGNCL